MSHILEITSEVLEQYETLEPEDIGQWAVVVNGAMVEFCNSKEEAQDTLNYTLDQQMVEGEDWEMGFDEAQEFGEDSYENDDDRWLNNDWEEM